MKPEAGAISHAGLLEKRAFEFCFAGFFFLNYHLLNAYLMPLHVNGNSDSFRRRWLCSTPVLRGVERILSDFPKATKLVKCHNRDENRGLSVPRALTCYTLCEVAVTVGTHNPVERGI